MTRPTVSQAYPKRWAMLAVLCLSLLLVIIDNTVINTALPTFVRQLGATNTELQWIVDAYTLLFAGLLLGAGALGDRFGRHRCLTGGLGVFVLGSVLAVLANSPRELIAARGVMGLGAALVMPSTLAILVAVFRSGAERAQALAIWTAVSGLGIAIGPTLGGALLEGFGWRAVFLINLPLAALAVRLGRKLVPSSFGRADGPFDLRGLLLGIASISALTWALIEAPRYGWLSPATLVVTGAAALGLALFVFAEQRTTNPLLPLEILRDRRFASASFGLAALFFGLFGTMFVLTQILQFVLGWHPLHAGLGPLPFAALLMLTAPYSPRLAARLGTRAVVVAGLATVAAGFGVISQATLAWGYPEYMLATLLMALGMGLALSPATEAIMASVPAGAASVGSATNSTIRELGGVLGVAVVGSVVASSYATALTPAVAALPASLGAVAKSSIGAATVLSQHLPGGAGAAFGHRAALAFIHAADRGFLIAAAVTLAGALIVRALMPASESRTAEIPARSEPEQHPRELAALGGPAELVGDAGVATI